MTTPPAERALPRVVAAELIGTGALVCAVVGSGVMAESLSGGNVAIALLANTIATGAALVALILTFAGVSGAHFNPVVTLVDALSRRPPVAEVVAVIGAQLAGGVVGVVVAHAMFELPFLQSSLKARAGPGQWLAEIVATAGLVIVIAGVSRARPAAVPFAVACWIIAAYWFTASTSFANPAVTFARGLSDTFAGIRPGDVPAFIVAQLVGGGVGAGVARLLFPPASEPA
ncbi:MAG: MIP/aquaporin family protein [Deltaproteobacteria bacterium]|nr:MIP/aquaporin family protein [Deltaproteobacteria bacterium]